jgi:hypothetical protein
LTDIIDKLVLLLAKAVWRPVRVESAVSKFGVPTDNIFSFSKVDWDPRKFKDLVSAAVPIGSSRESIKTFVETELELKCLELIVENPHEGQIILAGGLFAVDVVNTTGADEIISCGFGSAKMITGNVTIAFWIKNGKLSEISLRNREEII